MRRLPGSPGLRVPVMIVLALAASLASPGGGEAQLRPVVSNQIAVSGSEASLLLEFDDGQTFSIELRDGRVLVDGEAVGRYTRGDELDLAWRNLLGRVISLDDGPLAEALEAWTPPDSLGPEAMETATLLDRALEKALASPEAAAPAPPEPPAGLSAAQEKRLVAALLNRVDRLRLLAEAMEDLSVRDLRIHVDEDVSVDADTELDATIVAVDGDVDVYGTVRGDVVVVGGTVRLHEGGRVAGDVRLAEASLERDGGVVEGDVVEVPAREASARTPGVEELRKELEREIRREVLASVRQERRPSSPWSFVLDPLRYVGRGLAGLLENLVTFLILAVVAVFVVRFAGRNLQVVADTARRCPGRSAAVGIAGFILFLPVWILGTVVLAVSIVGIPALFVWIPLFPLAAFLAGGLGYLAVARNVGEWVGEQRYSSLDWLRGANTAYTVVAGLAVLMLAFVLANVVAMAGPWLGFLRGLLEAAGSIATGLAVVVGVGAVLLSRGGRLPDACLDFPPAPPPVDEPPGPAWPPPGPEPPPEAPRDAPRQAGEPPDRTAGAPEAPATGAPAEAPAVEKEGEGGEGGSTLEEERQDG